MALAGRGLHASLKGAPPVAALLRLGTGWLRHEHNQHPLFAEPETKPIGPRVHDTFDTAKPDAAPDTLYGKTNVFVREVGSLPLSCIA